MSYGTYPYGGAEYGGELVEGTGATVTPSAVALTVTLDQPTVSAGAGPESVAVTVTLNQVAVSTTGDATVLPDPVVVVAALPAAGVSSTVGVDSVVLAASMSAAGAASSVSPAVIAVVATVPVPAATARLARISAEALIQAIGEGRLARESLETLIRSVGDGRLARESLEALIQSVGDGRLARESVEVLITQSPQGADANFFTVIVGIPTLTIATGPNVDSTIVDIALPQATIGWTPAQDPIPVTVAFPDVAVSASVSPDPILVVTQVGTPIAGNPADNASVAPDPVVALVATPTAGVSIVVTPAALVAAVSVPSSSFVATATVTPIFTATFVFVPSAAAGTPTVVHPTAIRASSIFLSPTILTDETLPIPAGVGLWYDASQIIGLVDGDRVETWADSGFYGRDLISDWIDNWLYYSERIAGKPAVCPNPEEFYQYFESYDGTAFVTTNAVEIFMVAEGGIPEGEDMDGIAEGGFGTWGPGFTTALSLYEFDSSSINEYAFFTDPSGNYYYLNTESYDPVTFEDYPYPVDNYLYYGRRVPGDNWHEIHGLASTNADWVFPDGSLTVDAGTVSIWGIDYYRTTCVAEIIVYFRELTTDERDQVINYFDQKYTLFTLDMQPQSATWTGNAAATRARAYDPPVDTGAAVEAMEGVRQNRTFYV